MFQGRSLSVTTRATTEAISVAETKTHLKIQTTLEDTLLGVYIKAVSRQAENYLKRSLIKTTYKLSLDSFSSEIILPRTPPLSTASTDLIVSFTPSSGGLSCVVNSSNYTVDYDITPCRIYLGYSTSWPADVRVYKNAITVDYIAGWDSSVMPENIKLWLMEKVGIYHNHRSPIHEGERLQNLRRDFIDGLVDEYLIPDM